MSPASTNPPEHSISFLHTATGHVRTFGDLMAELAPDLAVRHDVDESLLAEARAAGGIEPELAGRIVRSMLGAASSGAGVVVCTCSTIGGVAEAAGRDWPIVTQRIDRAMANAAVALGPQVLIVAALSSTISPTRELVADSARQLGMPVSFREVVVEDAWHYFESERLEAYVDRIVTAVKANGPGADVVVLAQASMARAAEACADIPVPVLASPRIGVEAAINAFRRYVERQ